MNRPIKFRAWDGNHFIRSGHCIEFDGSTHKYSQGAVVERKNLTLMQFTGLLDKNGQEIYEGDILEVEENKGEVSYSVPGGRWFLRPKGGGRGFSFVDLALHEWEVIGNIYENPDLLQKSGENKS